MLRTLILILVAAALGGVLYWQQQHLRVQQIKLYTKDVLAGFDGTRRGRMYLSILGEVYDVSAGTQYYGKDQGYHHFVGKDATRAFVTGEFVKDLTDNVSDFGPDECAGLIHWRGFYRNHTEYKFRGRLAGAFYDSNGQPTEELARVEKKAAEAKSAQDQMRDIEAQFPRCNSRWNQEEGGHVWCDEGMYPRKLTLQHSGKETVRCACFKELGWSDIRQVYPGCAADAHECQVTPPGPSPQITRGFEPKSDQSDSSLRSDQTDSSQSDSTPSDVKTEL